MGSLGMGGPSSSRSRARPDSPGECVTSPHAEAQRRAGVFWKLFRKRAVVAKGLCKAPGCCALRGFEDLRVELKSWQTSRNSQEWRKMALTEVNKYV